MLGYVQLSVGGCRSWCHVFTGHVIGKEGLLLPSVSTKRGYAGGRKRVISAGSMDGSTAGHNSKVNNVEKTLVRLTLHERQGYAWVGIYSLSLVYDDE